MTLTCSFRNFSTNWDMTEVEGGWKDAILEQKALLIGCMFPGARDAPRCFVLVFTVRRSAE